MNYLQIIILEGSKEMVAICSNFLLGKCLVEIFQNIEVCIYK